MTVRIKRTILTNFISFALSFTFFTTKIKIYISRISNNWIVRKLFMSSMGLSYLIVTLAWRTENCIFPEKENTRRKPQHNHLINWGWGCANCYSLLWLLKYHIYKISNLVYKKSDFRLLPNKSIIFHLTEKKLSNKICTLKNVYWQMLSLL